MPCDIVLSLVKLEIVSIDNSYIADCSGKLAKKHTCLALY